MVRRARLRYNQPMISRWQHYYRRFWPQWLRPELLALTLVAALTRFWDVVAPQAVVFDEVYFKTYAGDYLTGNYYFDPHPPLGKLLLGGAAHLLGLSGPALANGDPGTLLRLLPALAGTLIIPIFYLLLRQLRASRRVATLGALLLLLDNALLVESRFILIDSMLVLFGLSAITLYLVARRRRGAAHWWLLAASAFCGGLAASTKWTGLAALGLVFIAWVAELPALRHAWRGALGQLAILVIVPILVYLSVFAVHFALLPRSGQGDAFMPNRFQATLIGNPQYNPKAHLGFFEKFWDLNVAMRQSEASLRTATHPYGSPWYTWPLMIRPVYYWAGQADGAGRQGNIYLLGNPLVWWGVLVGLAITLYGYIDQHKLFRRWRLPLLLAATGYVINFLPFSQIDRVMFLYHYFYALTFSLALAVLGVGIAAGWMEHEHTFWWFPSRGSAALYIGVVLVALAGFMYFAPLSYGWALSPAELQQHMWLQSWR